MRTLECCSPTRKRCLLIPKGESFCRKTSPNTLISPKARRLLGWGKASKSGSRLALPIIRQCCASALAGKEPGCRRSAAPPSGGAYSEAVLTAARCRVFAIDRDPDAVRRGRALAERHGGRLSILEGRFGDMAGLLAPVNTDPIAGIALDLGVS